MALRNVANNALFTNAESVLVKWTNGLKKVPLKYWRLAVLALLFIWICRNLALLVWYLIPTPALPHAPVAPSLSPSTVNTSARNVDIAALQGLHLFGDVSVQPAQEVPIIQQPRLEITKLNLELQGVIAANDPKLSWAIIGRASDQKLYKVNDEIDGARGVRIAEIHRVKVILNNNGKLEELWLYGEDGLNVASSTPQPTYTPPAPSNDAGDVQQSSVSRDQIEQASNIGDVVRFMVATENGRMIGYRVRPGRKRELFDQVGLKSDDIVISVNGIEVNEPQKVREVYQTLKNATEANLQVMRDGATHSIQITMSAEG